MRGAYGRPASGSRPVLATTLFHERVASSAASVLRGRLPVSPRIQYAKRLVGPLIALGVIRETDSWMALAPFGPAKKI